jgi:hypothetical protein
MEREMKHRMLVLVALLIPTAAMAKGECKPDVEKFCEGKGTDQVGACLEQHQAELSEACKAAWQSSQKPKP